MDISAFLNKKLYYIDDSSIYTQKLPMNNTFSHMALTDALLSYAGNTEKTILHMWESNRPTVLLGMMDTKLPEFEKAFDMLTRNDYEVLVRHSGGLAVPSDSGILNFSLLLKNPVANKRTIAEGYQLVSFLLQQALEKEGYSLLASEVPDSYCPGDYDLSFCGKKVAGLSQRRVKEGLAVMGYLAINGNQKTRSLLMKEFYSTGKAQQEDKKRYPIIDPLVMGTVGECLPTPPSTKNVRNHLLNVFSTQGMQVTPLPFSTDILSAYGTCAEKLRTRNQKMLGKLFQEEVFV